MLHLNGPILEPLIQSGKKILIIFFHGWGSNGDNLVDIGRYWQQHLPHAKFYFPNAPLPCEAGSGYAWFSLNISSVSEKRKNLLSAVPDIEEWIRNLQQKEQVTNQETFLAGFSQGAMLSLCLGLSYKDLAKGIIAYSGGLVGQENWQNPDRRVSYLLVHGKEDSVVPIEEFYFAKIILDKYELINEGLAIPHLDHSIDEEGVFAGLHFIRNLISEEKLD